VDIFAAKTCNILPKSITETKTAFYGFKKALNTYLPGQQKFRLRTHSVI